MRVCFVSEGQVARCGECSPRHIPLAIATIFLIGSLIATGVLFSHIGALSLAIGATGVMAFIAVALHRMTAALISKEAEPLTVKNTPVVEHSPPSQAVLPPSPPKPFDVLTYKGWTKLDEPFTSLTSSLDLCSREMRRKIGSEFWDYYYTLPPEQQQLLTVNDAIRGWNHLRLLLLTDEQFK